jgi:flagella basal body P-ring formation protein FlgA
MLNRARLLIVAGAAVLCMPMAVASGLCEHAREAVLRQAAERGWQATAQCRGTGSPPGLSDAEFVGVDTDRTPELRAGATAWPLKVRTQTGQARVQWVPLQLSLRSKAWVLVRDVQGGQALGAGDVELRWHNWAAGESPGVASFAATPSGRALRPLRAGQVIQPNLLASGDTAQRGDQVVLVIEEGPMELRLPARLLAPAKVGQEVRVQPLGRNEVLVGRLSTPTMVMGLKP